MKGFKYMYLTKIYNLPSFHSTFQEAIQEAQRIHAKQVNSITPLWIGAYLRDIEEPVTLFRTHCDEYIDIYVNTTGSDIEGARLVFFEEDINQLCDWVNSDYYHDIIIGTKVVLKKSIG